MSFGLRRKTRPAALETAVRHAADEGVTLIAAAGNEGRSVTYDDYYYYPAALEGVMAVGSVTKSQYSRTEGNVPAYSSFTNRLTSAASSYVGKSFFYVPGEDLLTTAKGNTYQTFTGTSASAAVFSGMMASLMSVSRAADGIEPRAALVTSSGAYGSVSYHRFSTAAQNLKNGSLMDAWWVGDYNQPSILRGSVELSGTLMDPSYQMRAVRVELVRPDGTIDNLYEAQRSADAPQQHVTFSINTGRYDDGDYTYHVIATYADGASQDVSADGTPRDPSADGTTRDAEMMLAEVSFRIDNRGKNYLLSAVDNGEPLIGAQVTLYAADGSVVQTGQTDSLGNFPVNAAEADKGGMIATVQGEEHLFVYELETHPRGNAYTLSGNASTLTVTASTKTLAKVKNASLLLMLSGGQAMEIATIAGSSTSGSFCTNMPLTFTVKGDAVALSREFSLADGDKVWNLDEELSTDVTLTLDSAFTDASGIRLLIGDNAYELPKEGGSVVTVPGKYDVAAIVYRQNSEDGSDKADYFKIALGQQNLTKNTTLAIGASVKAELTLEKGDVKQNEDQLVTLRFSDSEGRPITDVGSFYTLEDGTESYGSTLSSYSLRLNRAGEDGTWEDLDSQYVEWRRQDDAFVTTLSTSMMDNATGTYRMRPHSYQPWPFTFGDRDWHTFQVTAEETSPSARVNFRFNNYNG
ncbi:MAG: S8 family serine peptidase, partial [Clostridia bacterium]|nr:S8 family serine peptidase [Clostridia bacterium]